MVRDLGRKAGIRLQTEIARRTLREPEAGGFCARRETFRQRISALHELGRAAGAGVDSISARSAHHANTVTRKCRRRSWSARNAWSGVGQFPKFADQYYGVREGEDDGTLGKLYLIPTAETPVANIHREEILPETAAADLLLRLHAVFSRRGGRGGRRHARHDSRASVRQGGADQDREAGARLRRTGKNGGQRGAGAATARPALSRGSALHRRHGFRAARRPTTSKSGRRGRGAISKFRAARIARISRRAG